MKKIVRNNKTFMVNEELYQQIRKKSYLIEDEQLSLFPDVNKNKNNKSANEAELYRIFSDLRFNVKVSNIYSDCCKKIIGLSDEIEEAIKNDPNIPEIIKKLDMSKFLKEVVTSKVFWNNYRKYYAEKIVIEKKDISPWMLFVERIMKFITSKRFKEGTAKKTFYDEGPLFKYAKENGSNQNNTQNNNLTANPLGESVLYEDDIQNPSNNTANNNPTNPSQSSVNTSPQEIKKGEEAVDDGLDSAAKIIGTIAKSVDNNIPNKEKDSSEKKENIMDRSLEDIINNSSPEELLNLIEDLLKNPVNPVDYVGLLSLKEQVKGIISSYNANENDVTGKNNIEDFKKYILRYLKVRNNAIRNIKTFRSKITQDNCISFLEKYFNKKSNNYSNEILNPDKIISSVKNFKEKQFNIDKNNEDNVSKLLVNNLIFMRKVESAVLNKLSKNKAFLNNKKEVPETFNYYSYKKMLEEESFSISAEQNITFDTGDIVENDYIFLYGFASTLDLYINNVIIKIFNTPELSSLSKKIKNDINNTLNKEETVKNEINMEDSIREALKYIGNDDNKLTVEYYDEMFEYALSINTSINEIVTKATTELSSQLALFDPLHYKLISGDIFDTVKKVCQNDNARLESLKELYGFSLLTEACNKNKDDILNEKSVIKKLKNNENKLADLMTEIATRCKKTPLPDESEMSEYYKSNLQNSNRSRLISPALITSLIRIIMVHNERQQITVIDAIRQNNDIKSGYDVSQGYMVGYLGQPLLTLTFTKDDKYYGTIVFMYTFGAFSKIFGAWSNKFSITNSLKRLMRM